MREVKKKKKKKKNKLIGTEDKKHIKREVRPMWLREIERGFLKEELLDEGRKRKVKNGNVMW